METNQVSKQKKSGGAHSNKSGSRESSTKHEPHREHGTMGDIAEQASDYVARGASQVRELTRDHEGSAVLVGLVAGFGVGLLIGSALAAPHRRPKSWKDRMTAEGIGRRFLDRIEGMLPESIAEYCGKKA